nr:AAA family ATPase [Kibdelosporangium sp. MJ126-NF4]CEL22522.1 MoxR-like ATPases [Kibdelosporangium sp. MJ126-NF4]CTQ89378.1 MoxR-like ATPases [Kibdelosporangium sp. MJ126-NF4]
MAWDSYYRGDGVARDVVLAKPPPWRTFPRSSLAPVFLPPEGLIDAVNAALALRRPLLVTGPPGSGKSTVADSVATELKLGRVLRWHVTSQSTLKEALYRYDVLGRIHTHQLGRDTDDIAPYLQLGPLGTALAPADRPRALVIDELDKSDLDLPSDLLDVLERGEYDIPELSRHSPAEKSVRGTDDSSHRIVSGHVRCTEFPFIVITSNGERDFPAPFLRRCVRFSMPSLTDVDTVKQMVHAHLDSIDVDDGPAADLIGEFVRRVQAGELLALDQLLGAAFLLSGMDDLPDDRRGSLLETLLRELTRV